MNKHYEKLVVSLLLLIAIRLTHANRAGLEQKIIDAAMKFMGEE